MKTTVRMTVAALAAVGAVSVFAQVGDRWEPNVPAVTTNLSRAEVQAAAAQATKERVARGENERDHFMAGSNDVAPTASLSREEVRAQAINARPFQLINLDRS
jgi:hypothetical protein